MKLSDFKGEEAVDVLASLMAPAMAIAMDEELQERYRNISENGKEVASLVTYMMRNYKTEVLDIYSALYRDDPKNATPATLLRMLIEMFQDKEIRSLFFSQQGQSVQETSSGSVTENTEESEN